MQHLVSLVRVSFLRLVSTALLTLAWAALPWAARADVPWSTLSYTKFSTMQAVTGTGEAAWTIPYNADSSSEQAYKVVGVVLNNSSDILDGTPNYIPTVPGTTDWQTGAEWQVFVQAYPSATYGTEGDYGGAALWMGQNYGNVPEYASGHVLDSSYSYTNEEWIAEIDRLTSNGTLRAGDLVAVYAQGGKFYQGKFNVNEEHTNDSAFDFEIVILGHVGLPDAASITLAQIMNEDGTFKFSTDTSDASNPEHYQSTLVDLQGVSLTAAGLAAWGNDSDVTVTDGTREFTLLLGLDGFDAVAPPTGVFDVTGIFDQADGNRADGYKAGYRLWVTDASQFGVPEPSGVVLAALGAAGLAAIGLRRRRRRCAAQEVHGSSRT